MELKLVCNCGQKYKFDVEPVNQQMPFVVNCTVCGIDGTPFANALLAQSVPALHAVVAPPTPPPISVAPAPPRPMPAPRASAPAGAMSATVPAIPKYLQNNPATANNNFALGILGAFLGAIVGLLLVVGVIYILVGLRMSIFCIGIGPLIGFGARLMYRGTSSSLGFVCAIVAFFTIGAALFLSFGIIGILLSGFVTMVLGVGLAFKIASD